MNFFRNISKSYLLSCAVNKLKREPRILSGLSSRFYYEESSKVANMTGKYVVDLRSDTVTQPSKAMREVMASAIVGDDVFGEDPTVNELEARFAALMDMEAALFTSSGTMSNLIAVLAHCGGRGYEMITGDKTHMFLYEQGGAAQFGGVQTYTVPNLPDGTFDIDQMRARVRPPYRDLHEPITALVCVENTHAKCGGKVLPLDWLSQLAAVCAELKLPLHMDGARVFNAAAHLGVPVCDVVRGCTSVSVCLSKGLGTPVGSVLHGPADFIYRARRVRKALGGSTRQAGILAAAGLFALDKTVPRLIEDHRRAQTLAKAVEDLQHPWVRVSAKDVHTNIINLELDLQHVTPTTLCTSLASGDDVTVKCIPYSSSGVRLVLHLDITDELLDMAVTKLTKVISTLK